MGAIEDGFYEAYRDFVTDGVAASGVYQPEKSKQRALGALISAAIANAGFGGNIAAFYPTRAELDADVAHEAGAIGFVYSDAVDANNDLYIKTGASGAGGWTLTTGLHEIVEGLAQPYVDTAQAAVDDINAGYFREFFSFCEEDLREGYIAASVATNIAEGDFVGHSAFRTTPPIPAYDGQKFIVTAKGFGTLQAVVSMWDAQGNYLGNARNATATATEVICNHPDLRYVCFSASTSEAFSAVGVLLGNIPEMPKGTYPTDIYMTVGEKWPLFARSMMPDRRFPLFWNYTYSNDRAFQFDAAASGLDVLKLKTVLEGGFVCTLMRANARKYAKPANPAGHVNIIPLGDSTVQGTGAQGVVGDYHDWPNELSWQMTGIGRRAADDSGYFTSWGLDNVHFRGTRISVGGVVGHEGRGGWSTRDYLDLESKAGVPNAFWNPAANSGAGGFDLDFYLTENGFDDVSIADGVNATGSNLIMPIMLGWNDVDGRSDAEMVADLGELIDVIRSGRADTKMILMGHAAPASILPMYRGTGPSPVPSETRLVEARAVMTKLLRRLDTVMVDVGAAKAVPYLRWAPQFDGETGFKSFDTLTIAPWMTDTYKATVDYVHPGRYGNMFVAHALKGFLSQPGWIS